MSVDGQPRAHSCNSTKTSELFTYDTSETINFQTEERTVFYGLSAITSESWCCGMEWYYNQEDQRIYTKANALFIQVNANFQVTLNVLSYLKETTNQ
jgi:hypothetical protein